MHKFFLSSLTFLLILFFNCSVTSPNYDDHRVCWEEAVGTGVWWVENQKGGNTVSRFEWFQDSIVGYDIYYNPRQTIRYNTWPPDTIDSLEVTYVEKWKAYRLGGNKEFIDKDGVQVYINQVKWKLMYGGSQVYDYASYQYWGIYSVQSDSISFGYVNDFDEFCWFWCKKTLSKNLKWGIYSNSNLER